MRSLRKELLTTARGSTVEIGAGTGYFSLNLMQAGVIGEVCATDISPGMLSTFSANAQRLGLERVTATRAEGGRWCDRQFAVRASATAALIAAGSSAGASYGRPPEYPGVSRFTYSTEAASTFRA